MLDEARRLAPRFAARAAATDRDGTFPVEDFADLRASGFFGLTVPSTLGGGGAGFAEYADVAYELARGNGATALVFNMHASVTGALVGVSDRMAETLGLPHEALAARDEHLKAAAAGSWYAVAMSERGAGSRLSEISTTYRRTEDGYRIAGAKTFCSGAGHADAYLIAARAEDDPAQVSQFLVPAGPGLRVEETWDSLGMRATGSHDLHIDVTVPPAALLGGVEGLALMVAQLAPHWMVASYAAVYVGVARAAVDAAVAHLTERGLTHLPSVRTRIGRADAAVEAAHLAVREAARRVDEKPGDAETKRWVWRAKLLAGTTAAEVAASMLEAAGTSAMRRGNQLERLYRDARAGSLQPATSDVCADWLGVEALGGDPDAGGVTPRW
ncbi:acyl-CoA dehydrogenase family protein [Actinoplanes sp. NBRC 101535]|uniref:acyl-CoA dehydrogenase family protein n=1 Tax=Actinoplanes sp. NBRC 101535 TaxID=3032196 RepID=UPI0024A36750|nr:acyl-CoA dehydrogenase family protein [Actinoplanes sp. NBRC 101535]GLY08088.1 acyl-CoA dehydrogenase [Actinoplanes sp. NBRC 101535]